MSTIVKGFRSTKFWAELNSKELSSLYQVATPTPARVKSLLEIVEKTQSDGRVTSYLLRYIRETPLLKTFVRFITGADSIISRDLIRVQFFNNTIEPYPKAYTCFRILNLPWNFVSYSHLEKNFDKVLRDPKYW